MEVYQKLARPLGCVNIVQYFRAWQEDRHMFMQTEYCGRGNLKSFVRRHGYPITGEEIPEATLWFWMHSLCSALLHVHSHGIVHLDVKTENIFIALDGTLKLGDFGLAMEISCDDDGHEGDTTYMAYELLSDGYKRHPSADIFSLGMMMFEIASRYIIEFMLFDK